MCKYNYETIDWSKSPLIEGYAESTNGHIMDIEISGEYKNSTLENNTEKENTSEK